jgi:hypothetical protein
MLSLDRFLSCPSLVLKPLEARTCLDWRPCPGGLVEARSGDMDVSPVRGDGWVTESRDSVVGAVDGDTERPESGFSPVVSHIEGCRCWFPARKG